MGDRNITKMGHSHRISMKIGPNKGKHGSGGRFFRSWVEKTARKGKKRPKTGKTNRMFFQKFPKKSSSPLGVGPTWSMSIL